jgi:hypothetical protein
MGKGFKNETKEKRSIKLRWSVKMAGNTSLKIGMYDFTNLKANRFKIHGYDHQFVVVSNVRHQVKKQPTSEETFPLLVFISISTSF